jgi:rhodanese-related sulfurtransferase
MGEARSADQLLEAARARFERVSAEEAAAEQARGALIVDTRTTEQRRAQGVIPGTVAIDRTVFEWRLDPTSPSHDPRVRDHDARIVVVCRQGFSSSLAAASLQDLGLHRATDVIGGFEAWRDAGLPVEPFDEARHRPPDADTV